MLLGGQQLTVRRRSGIAAGRGSYYIVQRESVNSFGLWYRRYMSRQLDGCHIDKIRAMYALRSDDFFRPQPEDGEDEITFRMPIFFRGTGLMAWLTQGIVYAVSFNNCSNNVSVVKWGFESP